MQCASAILPPDSGPQIHQELSALGGLDAIQATLPDWPVSDDTIMHLATVEGERMRKMYYAVS